MKNGGKMSFYSEIEKFKEFDMEKYIKELTHEDIKRSIRKEKLTKFDFLNLLSPKAKDHLEEIAKVAQRRSEQQFGKVIGLYIPIYISNYCTNECTYCGFNKNNKIDRKHLNLNEIEAEAVEIAKTGIRHILLLTGEAEGLVGVDYIENAVKILKKHFDSVVIEIYPLETEEYKRLGNIGVDGLTVYQEVYDENIYKSVHLGGKKTDYMWRLDTPERGAKAGLRSINIGPLFGLGDLVEEAYLSGLHAKYLTDKYLNSEFSISLPRINEAEGGFKSKYILDDTSFAQFLLAYRLFLPKAGINISTREVAEFRDNLIGLGVTKFSAGSKTNVGAYSDMDKSTPQFEISDNRSVAETEKAIRERGYQVVHKDWELIV